jgi:hypothetical protein
MRHPLIDAAQALHAALKDIIATHPGGAANPEALRRIGQLCVAARLTVRHPECRAAIRAVEAYAQRLYSDESSEASEQAFLRLRVLTALSAFRRALRSADPEPTNPPLLSTPANGQDRPAL